MTEAPCYLKIRGDNEEGVIRAFYAMSDESFEVEVATLSMQVASEEDAFEEWKAMLTKAHRKSLERITGLKVVSSYERKPHESN